MTQFLKNYELKNKHKCQLCSALRRKPFIVQHGGANAVMDRVNDRGRANIEGNTRVTLRRGANSETEGAMYIDRMSDSPNIHINEFGQSVIIGFAVLNTMQKFS